MTSPDVSLRSFTVISAAILGWIVALSAALRIFYGARMSSGWLVVGLMVTLVVAGAVVMMRELFSEVETRQPWEATIRRKLRVAVRSKDQVKTPAARRRTALKHYRQVFNLEPRAETVNRRRSRKARSGPPIVIRDAVSIY